jgi:CBS domain-containing protein
MNVSDIMTKDVVSVKKETSLKEAAGLLAKLRIHGMPVVDDQNKAIGIITESDFFTKDSSNIYLPTFLDFVKGDLADTEKGIDKAVLDQTTKVADIMTEKCLMVKPNLSLKELVDLIKESNFNSLPVVDDSGTLIGIVTVMDLIRLL